MLSSGKMFNYFSRWDILTMATWGWGSKMGNSGKVVKCMGLFRRCNWG